MKHQLHTIEIIYLGEKDQDLELVLEAILEDAYNAEFIEKEYENEETSLYFAISKESLEDEEKFIQEIEVEFPNVQVKIHKIPQQ